MSRSHLQQHHPFIMPAPKDKTHSVISSLFIGPRAENLDEFSGNITAVLEELRDARLRYFKEDEENGYDFIPQAVRETKEFKRSTARTAVAVRQAARMLANHSIPFWSPRYQAHMCTDLTMPSMLGYFMTMLYNPNNVAVEASPLSTVAEIEVGEQLCELFGFENNPTDKNTPTAWGHVTCDGTVANLESVWVARNLKFYPLSVRKAMDDEDGPLRFVPETFSVRTCQGKLKRYRDLTTWELLNLKPKTILDIPERLQGEFGITPKWLEEALDPYNIQTIGKDTLERDFGLDKPPQYFVPSTKHYSWPKSAAIMGIGSNNAVSVGVDNEARVDMARLEELLEERLANQQAVYTVVAVVGSTEEGAVDPLRKILGLRQRFQAKGLSFIVHGDAAWGGYFATMLPRGPTPLPGPVDPSVISGRGVSMAGRDGGADGLVPDLSLRVETQEDLFALRFCDSITVDPHKAGYVPYPAGALTYRDGRIKNLVTWTSPYLSQGSVTSIGIYGVEGSKPGASAMSTWLSNQCVGLDQNGYGALLSEACLTSSRLSALWAALTTDTSSFICVPFNPIPSEAAGESVEEQEKERRRIRDEILSKTNAEILAADAAKPPKEPKTMALLRALGSDLNINAFALNWKDKNGIPNTDVTEANYFMTRVVSKLSVENPDDQPTKIPLYLTSTKFEHKYYGKCAQNFKRRLHLDASSHEELMVLRNVVMSPLATFTEKGDFLNMLGKAFTDIVNQEVKVMRTRNDASPDYHSFLTRGTGGRIFLSYRQMFHMSKHRRQIILEVEFADPEAAGIYSDLKQNTEEELVFKTADKIDLLDKLASVKPGQKGAELEGNLTTKSNGIIVPRIKVRIISVLKNRPLNAVAHDESYPSGYTPFYVYGSGGSDAGEQKLHIDHILTRSPNIVLSASVGFTPDDTGSQPFPTDLLSRGGILILDGIHEAAMQPFPDTIPDLEKFFFRPGAEFKARILADPRAADASAKGLLDEVLAKGEVLATGTVAIRDDAEVTVDVEKVNRDLWKEKEEDRVGRWRERFSKIGKEMAERKKHGDD